MSFEVRLFGGFEVLIGGKPMPPLRSKREQWLLALLVLRHGVDTQRDWLAATLWPDNPEEQALFYLRKGLSNLRKALGDEAGRLVSPTSRTLRLGLDGAAVDVVAFDTAQSLSDRVGVYAGLLLPDCQEEWALLERGQRELAYFDALEKLALETDPAGAVRWLRLLVTADPYRESAHRSLMQALADCGDTAAVTVVYRELREKLYRELNTEVSAETEALYQSLLSGRVVASVQAKPVEVKETGRHLPAPLSDLIGREADIAEIRQWLGERRLVTLVGAGGVGKTRLSIAVAEAELPRFEHGVWFVDLAALADPALVPVTVAKALGVPESDSLVEALAGRSLLVVLDNCEHVLAACAEMVFGLLSACAGLTILATSRQALNVSGEQVYRAPSLAVPAVGVEDGLADFEAVRLFVDRAKRVQSGFVLGARNAQDVVEICRDLDGIALAIEMAAARLRSLSVAEIRTRLSDRFRLLKSGNFGALPRQHTLRATIDWSYDQLSEPERLVLRFVSVFAGGWTLESASSVVGSDSEDVLELLAGLVDKSLAIAEDFGDGTRYRLLQTVRQYAHYRLVESEELGTARARHRDYFASFALDMRPKLVAADQAHWFSALEAEHDNFRQALGFCLEDPNGGEPGLQLAGALSRFWLIRGHIAEGRERFAAALGHPSAQVRTRDRAIALNGAGLLAWRQSDYTAGVAYYQESLSITRELGLEMDTARALNNLALMTRDLGDYDAARAMHEEALELVRRSDDRLIQGTLLSNLGVVYHYQGEFELAQATFEEGLAVQREMGDRSGVSTSLNSLGGVALDQGDLACALACHTEGLSITREVSDGYGSALHLYGLGCVAEQKGDLVGARPLLLESLELLLELGERTLITEFFSVFASMARKEGLYGRAVRLMGARSALREASGSPLPGFLVERLSAEVAALRGLVSSDEFEAEWAAGSAMSLDEAVRACLAAPVTGI